MNPVRSIVRLVLAWLAIWFPGGYVCRPALQRARGVRIGRNVWISQSVFFDDVYPEAITIGDNCTLGLRSAILCHVHPAARGQKGQPRPVVVGNNVFVGPHCVIMPGVRVGEGAVIKAGSVVNVDVPAGTFWGGSGGRPLARVTVPLTAATNYDDFVRGLKPIHTTHDSGAESGKP
jgi:acetyltransferase-like isoleucine patch superfamily enzyme